MYESPINIYEMQRDIHRKMIQDQEEKVMECMWEYGINVDKEELIKALKYDRHQYNKGYRDGYEDGKEQEKWIPCSERLPEEETDVLVCNDNGDIEISRGSYSTEIKNEFIWYTTGCRFGKVIAWKLLPRPYTESEVNK